MDPTLAVLSRALLIVLPEALMLLLGTALLTAGAFVKLSRRTWCALAVATVAIAAAALLSIWNDRADAYASVVLNDTLSRYARLGFLFFTLVILATAHDQVDDSRASDLFGTILILSAGSMLVAAANDLILMFVALELVSIPTYLLLYLPRRDERTREAATKYFFLSIFSSGLLLFGMAYLYGLSGMSNLKALGFAARFVPEVPNTQFGLIAVVFVLAGLAFRVAAVPLHFYAPDVYEGSPAFMAALLSWVPKGIGMIAIIRVLTSTLGGLNSPVADKGFLLAWVIAAASMTLGNTVALLQNNLKRLFAYSSIAHAGYMMTGVAAAFHNTQGSLPLAFGAEGILLYLLAYGLMTLGAFAIIVALGGPDREIATVDDLNGLAKSHPRTALAMTVFLFSLAGIPPLAGFWGKYQIFASALSSINDDYARSYQYLVVIGLLNAAIGAYYYLRIIVAMYFKTADQELTTKIAWPTGAAIVACALLTIGFGVYPSPTCNVTRRAAIEAIRSPEVTAAPRTATRVVDRSN